MSMPTGPEDAAPARTLELAGGHNFRDVGGYPAVGGRQVAWRQVFRSGTLAYLTEADHDHLAALGIRFICDLRTNRERRGRPTRWLEDHDVEIWWRDHDASTADLAATLAGSDPTAEKARQLMMALYADLPYDQAPAYAELLRRLATGQLPLLFHCSAGKDRTGVLTALLLDLLGVDRVTIFGDYVLSDDHFDRLLLMFTRDRHLHDIQSIDPERFTPLLRADPDYLMAMFEAVDARHASTEDYVREVLGLSQEEISAIRTRLLK